MRRNIEPGHLYVVIVIPEAKSHQANLHADGINEKKAKNTGNEKTFSIPLWPFSANTEKDAPTHFWCCWWMSSKEQQRSTAFDTPAFGARKYFWPPTSPEEILKELGLKTRELKWQELASREHEKL